MTAGINALENKLCQGNLRLHCCASARLAAASEASKGVQAAIGIRSAPDGVILSRAAADYEMLSRLDDPARNPSNRRPLTDTQLFELPTHTFRPSKGASSHAQREPSSSSHDPSPMSASSSTQGTAFDHRDGIVDACPWCLAFTCCVWSLLKASTSIIAYLRKAPGKQARLLAPPVLTL